MENASFTGVYRIRDCERFPELHTNIFSGVCYAWKKGDGTYIVLPMGEDNVPHGNCYLLDTSDFSLLFQRYAAKISPRGLVSRPPLCSDSPDLLGAWYEESLALISSGQEPCSFHLTDACSVDGKASCPAISSDEAMFSPAWHPDDLCRLPQEEPSLDLPGLSRPSGSGLPPPPGKNAAGADKAALAQGSADAAEKKDAGEKQEDEEARSLRLERRMRAKFEALLLRMEQDAGPEQEEELSRLLVLGSNFTWKQKFMFTEFGLALRRKQKFSLALRSHMRALDLAPNDEHILFNVARAEYELGNADMARQFLDKALAVAPEFGIAKNFQSFLLASV